MRTLRKLLVMVATSALVVGCGTMQPPRHTNSPEESMAEAVAVEPQTPAGEEFQLRSEGDGPTNFFANKDAADNKDEDSPDKLFRGTGRFVKQVVGAPQAEPKTGDVTLNFENTDIREVVKVILGDLLQLNYVLDPGVRGGVTMQTGRPLSRDVLLPTLETLLRMNGAAMVVVDGVYQVMPLAKAPRGNLNPQLADAAGALPSGFSVQVVPLRYISAEEMGKILQPLVVEGSVIQTDPKRNLMVLAGNARELRYMLDTIETFDVDWIKGMSVGFFQLQYSNMEDVLKDLGSILGGEGGANAMLGGMIKVMPIESINGLLVVTQRPEYLDQVAEWVKRLDLLGGSGGDKERLFVYRVRNGDAEKLADLLGKLFEKDKKSTTKAASVAPGQEAKTIESSQPDGGQAKPAAPASAPSASGSLAGASSEVRVVADVDNNTLLISATPRDYENILRVLEQLDIIPLQVHIEATIIEVALTGDLKYGVQWAFKTHNGNYTGNGTWDGTLDGTTAGLGGFLPGFNWSLVNAADQVRAAISLYAGDTNVNVLSAPSVMVLDNQEAKIQVGDQVPIATQQQQSTLLNSTTTTNTGSNIINSIQYRDTGVLLTVKPRVNPGGLVTLEIEQEVSSVAQTTSSALDSPTIKTRKLSSKVAVQSGQAVVLGGLIRDETTDGKGGVPGLYDMPVLGPLFGETKQSSNRTELLVVLTPRVIGNARDAQRITDDFRRRMQGMRDWKDLRW